VHAWFGDVTLTRILLQRGLGAIYVVAFWCVVQQFQPLLGVRGLLPVPAFLQRASFREAPSLFHWHYSDRLATTVGWLGLVLAVLVTTGVSDKGPVWVSLAIWLVLYGLYLSIVNVGQTFYGFGWESMLLEAGFFAAFLGPVGMAPSLVPVLALRWMLFRVELGAGLIKLRGDRCWRDLSCLYYHHETQPLPNPLSAYFHHLPKMLHRASVAFSHFVQVVVPFGLFGPEWVAAVAGCLIIVHQLVLIVSGNYAWLNWLTVVLGFSAFSDRALATLVPFELASGMARPMTFQWLMYGLAVATMALSIKPTLNLFSKHQAMNETYNPLHLVGSYGAFGSVTRQRYEVVLEGTLGEKNAASEEWAEYRFKGKPGEPERRPRQWAPYHLRLDWLMWFLPLRVVVTDGGVLVGRHPVWFVRLVEKLLVADPATLALLGPDPFLGQAPSRVRASLYLYQLLSPRERRQARAYWKRIYIGQYLSARTRFEIG
jgi:hypothetical protein